MFDPSKPFEVVEQPASTFDPSKPFEVVESSFDPSKPFEVIDDSPQKKMGAQEAYKAAKLILARAKEQQAAEDARNASILGIVPLVDENDGTIKRLLKRAYLGAAGAAPSLLSQAGAALEMTGASDAGALSEVAGGLQVVGGEAQDRLANIGQHVGGGFVGDVAQAVPQSVIASSPALAVAPAGILATTPVAGLQQFLSSYAEQKQAYQEMGMGEKQAAETAIAPALSSGLVTSIVTAGFGNTGVEALSQEPVKAGFKQAIANYLKQIGLEATEEGLDQTVQAIISKNSSQPNKTLPEAMKEIGIASIAGGFSSGVINAPNLVTKPKSNTEAVAEALGNPDPKEEATVPTEEKVDEDAGLKAWDEQLGLNDEYAVAATETAKTEPDVQEEVAAKPIEQKAELIDIAQKQPPSDALGITPQVPAVVKQVANVVSPYTASTFSGVRKILSLWSEPLTEVVERQSGTTGKTIAARARKALSVRGEVLGRVQPDLVNVLHDARGGFGEKGKAVDWLQTVAYSQGSTGHQYGFSNMVGIENDSVYNQAPPVAKKIIDGLRRLNLKLSTTAQLLGIKTRDQQTGKLKPFIAHPQGKYYVRRASEHLMAIMEIGRVNPQDPLFTALAEVLADANGIQGAVALSRLKKYVDRGITKVAPFEIERVFDNFPTHMRYVIPGGGYIEMQLLETNPYSYALGMVNGATHRLGFIAEFGQNYEQLDKLRDQFQYEGGNVKDFNNLVRSLNAMPVELGLKPDNPLYSAYKAWEFISTVFKTGWLSAAAIVNIPEFIGTTQAYAGTRDFLNAWKELIKNPRAAAEETVRWGARTQNIVNLTVDPNHKLRDYGRLFRDVVGRLTLLNQVNEATELVAAVTGLEMAKRIKAGKFSEFDEERLRAFKYSPQQIQEFKARTASENEYRDLARRFTEFAVGTTSVPAEKSRAASSRVYKNIVAFDSYAQMKYNRTIRTNKMVWEALKSQKNVKQALGIASRYYLGSVVSGAAAILLSALATGGWWALKRKAEEAREDKATFIRDSLVYATFGGPLQTIMNTFSEPEYYWFSKAAGTTIPGSILQEIWAFNRGIGKYRDRDGLEKSFQFLRSNIKITRPLATAAAVVGVGNESKKQDAAIASFIRWKHKTLGGGKYTPDTADESDIQFRMNMRRAAEAIRDGKDPLEHIFKALETDGKDLASVAKSIRGKRLTNGLSDEQKLKMMQELPSWVSETIFTHDEVLNAWAAAMTSQ